MRRKFIAIILATLALITSLALITGCAPPQVAIIGTWECRDDSIAHEWMCNFTFNSQGRFVDRDGDVGNWSISGDRLNLEFDMGFATSLTFRISMNRLTIDHGDDIHVVLERVNSDDIDIG